MAKTKNRLDLERGDYHSLPSLSYCLVFGIRRKGKPCDIREATGQIKNSCLLLRSKTLNMEMVKLMEEEEQTIETPRIMS